ncbi:hypothetical protein H4R33_000492 [Dimargaris cristalligena]|nr:hypothetical protein H4R33_000492 [Dimargaris cristalligena]
MAAAKRKQVKNACTNCQKACKKCDDARPCQRCVKYGLEDSCHNSARKERKKGIKRGPYKRRQTRSATEAHRRASISSDNTVGSSTTGHPSLTDLVTPQTSPSSYPYDGMAAVAAAAAASAEGGGGGGPSYSARQQPTQPMGYAAAHPHLAPLYPPPIEVPGVYPTGRSSTGMPTPVAEIPEDPLSAHPSAGGGTSESKLSILSELCSAVLDTRPEPVPVVPSNRASPEAVAAVAQLRPGTRPSSPTHRLTSQLYDVHIQSPLYPSNTTLPRVVPSTSSVRSSVDPGSPSIAAAHHQYPLHAHRQHAPAGRSLGLASSSSRLARRRSHTVGGSQRSPNWPPCREGAAPPLPTSPHYHYPPGEGTSGSPGGPVRRQSGLRSTRSTSSMRLSPPDQNRMAISPSPPPPLPPLPRIIMTSRADRQLPPELPPLSPAATPLTSTDRRPSPILSVEPSHKRRRSFSAHTQPSADPATPTTTTTAAAGASPRLTRFSDPNLRASSTFYATITHGTETSRPGCSSGPAGSYQRADPFYPHKVQLPSPLPTPVTGVFSSEKPHPLRLADYRADIPPPPPDVATLAPLSPQTPASTDFQLPPLKDPEGATAGGGSTLHHRKLTPSSTVMTPDTNDMRLEDRSQAAIASFNQKFPPPSRSSLGLGLGSRTISSTSSTTTTTTSPTLADTTLREDFSHRRSAFTPTFSASGFPIDHPFHHSGTKLPPPPVPQLPSQHRSFPELGRSAASGQPEGLTSSPLPPPPLPAFRLQQRHRNFTAPDSTRPTLPHLPHPLQQGNSGGTLGGGGGSGSPPPATALSCPNTPYDRIHHQVFANESGRTGGVEALDQNPTTAGHDEPPAGPDSTDGQWSAVPTGAAPHSSSSRVVSPM